MSETIPPVGDNVSQPKTSALAIWSLVLGILSLICCSIFAAIPSVICGHKGLNRIKNSGGALTGQGLAIAGLVIGYLGIALAIFTIPLMMAIAIPNFVKARATAQMNGCVNNLRAIDSAKQRWAMEHHKQPTDVPTETDLLSYLGGQMPKCPAEGVYLLNTVAEPPTCSIPTHKLDH